jgi:subtilisin family serine protease
MIFIYKSNNIKVIKYRLIVSITFFIAFIMHVHGQNEHKVDGRLWRADSTVNQNIIILLDKQADLSAAKYIKGKDAKATYVYNTLRAHADSHQLKMKNILKARGRLFSSFYLVNMLALKANKALIHEIAQWPEVKKVLLDGTVKLNIIPGNERSSNGLRGVEWNLSHIGVPSVWNLGFTGQNVVIGGQDTGYEWDDPALINKYRGWNGTSADHNYNWHDAIHGDNPLSGGSNSCGYNSNFPCDDHNHGTHTMGTMVGDDGAGNQIGVAPGAKWIGCRNMENGYGTPTTYLECFEWFLAPYALGSTSAYGDPTKMPHVINNSWGCPPIEGCDATNFPIMEMAVNNLRMAGCVVVVSAGNDGSGCGTVNDPSAIFEGSLSVGATNNTDQIASFSSRGPVTVDGSNRLKPNVTAPGVGIRSCITGANNYAVWQGTSMAGPHVAGLVALIISANPKLAGEVEVIEDIIEQTTVNLTTTLQNCGAVLGTSVPNNTFGYGRINALAAVNMALSSQYTPYVTQDNNWVITNPQNGLVLVSPNDSRFRIQVSDAGNISITKIMNKAPNSIEVTGASLEMKSPSSKVILRSQNNTYWQLNIDNNGALTTSQIVVLPAHTQIQTGDLFISNGAKGVLLKSIDNTCFITRITNLRKIIAIPAICQN